MTASVSQVSQINSVSSTTPGSTGSSSSSILPGNGGGTPQPEINITGNISYVANIDTHTGGRGLSSGAIGGIVGGIIGGVLALGILGFLLYRNKAKQNQITTTGTPYNRDEDQGHRQPEPKPFITEETRPAIRYPDLDAVAIQEETEPAGGRLRYPDQ